MGHQLRQAWRVLRRRPLLSTVITLTIGGAIAAIVVAFAVVQGVLLRPLPYAQPERLVSLWEVHDSNPRNVVSPANYLAWRDGLRAVDRLAALVEISAALTSDGEAEQVGVMIASAEYFEIVGAVPLAGRFYRTAEDVEGGPAVAVIGEQFWRRKYAADPGIVGETIVLNGASYEVIGVMAGRYDFVPRGNFAGIGARDLWIPPRYGVQARSFSGRSLQILGRLAPRATVASAQREASVLAVDLAETFPQRNQGWGVVLVPLRDDMVRDARTTVWIVFGAVCFVLLIACANVANLLLVRASERQQEMAVRAALGAGRSALVRQLLTESGLLVGLGGIAGILGAAWGINALVAASPDLPRIDGVGLNWVVIGFALGATAVAALLVGLVPGLELSGRGPAAWLTQRGTIGRRHGRRLRNILVGAQVAMSFVLLVGAGLLIRSLVNRLQVDIGARVDDILVGHVAPSGPKYRTPDQRVVLYENLVAAAGRVPGVERATLASIVPMSGQYQSTGFEPLDRPPPPPGQHIGADVRFVHHEYHQAMSIPLLAGRYLADSDRPGQPMAVLINEAGARTVWPGKSALGQRIRMEWGDTLYAEIVGIVGDVHLNGPDDGGDRTTLYWEYRQFGAPTRMVLVARGRDGEPSLPALRAAVREVDPTLPLYNARTMASYHDKVMARPRFTTIALGLFAALALALAGLGVYGVMAYATQQRHREIGIRLALGARQPAVVGMILREGTRVIAPALVAGGVGALLLARLLRTLVFGVGPNDPVAFVGGLAIIGLTALLACWIPARRAAGIQPVDVIRE